MLLKSPTSLGSIPYASATGNMFVILISKKKLWTIFFSKQCLAFAMYLKLFSAFQVHSDHVLYILGCFKEKGKSLFLVASQKSFRYLI